VVDVAARGELGAPAIERALARGIGTPAPTWEPRAFATTILEAAGIQR